VRSYGLYCPASPAARVEWRLGIVHHDHQMLLAARVFFASLGVTALDQ
jgi:hypothetical protein